MAVIRSFTAGFLDLIKCSVLDERIDMIFSLDVPAKVKKVRIVGANVSDKTPPPGLGLWPSDHGSVTADLQF